MTDVNVLFTKWFSFYLDYEYPVNLLISCLSDNTINNQHKFMNLVYALEHITVKDLNNELAKIYYSNADQQIVDEIESIIREEKSINQNNFLSKLKSRLSKNRKLSEKFGSFLSQLKIPIEELFNEELEIFVNKIVNTRNNFAHVNDKDPKIQIEELGMYNKKIELILLFTFYLKLGIPVEQLKIKFRQHRMYNRIAQS